jgi:hypothetical protein
VSILVSLCNGNPKKTGLLLVSDDLSLVRRPAEPRGIPLGSTHGLTADERWLLFVKSGRIIVVDRHNFALRQIYRFSYARDVHSILLLGNRLLAVATYQNAVVEMSFHNGLIAHGEHIIWPPNKEKVGLDKDHLNSICFYEGRILVSALGEKVGPLWRDSTEGFVVDIGSGERIASGFRHPHSLMSLGKSLFLCESMKQLVVDVTGSRSTKIEGYARGLCSAQMGLYAGTSKGRMVSKSTGLIANPADVGETAGVCGIHLLDPANLGVRKSLVLDETEIYDLLFIEEDGSAWPMIQL